MSWHLPLDQTPSTAGQYDCNPSHIQHMLMADDPQLPLITSPLGSVHFIQVRQMLGEICVNYFFKTK